jgi:hypothetical protein
MVKEPDMSEPVGFMSPAAIHNLKTKSRSVDVHRKLGRHACVPVYRAPDSPSDVVNKLYIYAEQIELLLRNPI